MTATITTRAEGLVRALKKIGAPQKAENALVLGATPDLEETVARLLKPKRLVARSLVAPTLNGPSNDGVFDLGDETGPFQLVIAGDGFEAASLSGVRDRMQTLARLAADDACVGLWIATLAAGRIDAETGAGDYDGLLFPFSAAGGQLGPDALATTPLSASSWMLMARACGFEVTACEGFGQQPLPDEMAVHAGRLAIYDSRELDSGRLLMVLRKTGVRR